MDMLRCPQAPAGRYSVKLHVANAKVPYRVQIGGHQPIFFYESNGLVRLKEDGSSTILDQAPTVGTEEPFEGELCPCEVAWLGGVPGFDYRRDYEFTVERLD